MVKRALTLLTSILIALPLLMPFNIYAEDTAVVVGTDVSLISTNLLKTDEWSIASGNMTGYYNQFIYHVTVQLDNNYVGYIKFSLSISYMNRPQSGLRQDTETVTRKVFINGDKAEFNFDITSWYSDDPLLRNTTNGTPNAIIQEQGVTLLSELDSIQQIIDILNDLYNSQDQIEGLMSNQLTQLQLVVSNTSLANQYLDTISKLRQFNIPIESWRANFYPLYRYNPSDIHQYYYWNYPTYNYTNGDRIINIWNTRDRKTIFILGTYTNLSSSDYLNYFGFTSSNGSFTVEYEDILYSRIGDYKIIKFTINHSANQTIYIDAINTISGMCFFYLGDSEDKNISTDFALQFGLTNKLLDDLDIIANGTAQSSSAASSNDLANEQLQTDSNTLFTQEDNFKSDMNNAMQNVNNSFRLSDMGTKFVSSAQWVRTQYEQLTNNTPFASLITFSLITGLALILLGKVYK